MEDPLSWFDQGKLECIHLASDGTGGDTTLSFQPPLNCDYLIILAHGWHDDNGASRTCQWLWQDDLNTLNIGVSVAGTMANTNRWPLSQADHTFTYTTPSDTFGLYCTYKCYPQWKVSALAAGKKCYIDAVVIKRWSAGDQSGSNA